MSEREENQVGRLVLMLSHTILKNRNRHMAAIGLTSGQADCLRFCLEREGGTVTDLKNYLGVTHQTAQGLVRRLAEKGLLKNENATITVLVPRQAVQAEESAAFVERTFGGSLPAFLAAFRGDRKLKDEEAEAIRRLIDDYQEEAR